MARQRPGAHIMAVILAILVAAVVVLVAMELNRRRAMGAREPVTGSAAGGLRPLVALEATAGEPPDGVRRRR